MEYSSAHRLAADIRASEEYQTYHTLREEVMGDETVAALIREYKKLQVSLQMAAMSGQTPDSEDMQRFQQLASLLYMNSDVQAYLMAEMQMQKTLADIFKILTEAAGIRFDVPDKQ